MSRPLHPMTFATRPQGFGRRGVSIAELRARAQRRADNLQAVRDLIRWVVVPFLAASCFIYFGGL
jgi:hypothetical protein